jgi:hypothetical protein
MGKKKRSSSANFTVRGKRVDLGGTFAKVGGVLLGCAVGTFVANTIGKKDAVSGVDLLGLDGETSGYVTPFVTLAGGLAVSHLASSETLKNIGLGIMAVGGAKLVNNVAGKSLVSLSGTDEEKDVPVLLPGIGGVSEYDQLPSQNFLETQYSEPVLEPTASDVAEPVGGTVLL